MLIDPTASSATASTFSSSGQGSSGSASLCSLCGTRLTGGACPACALGFLLNGPQSEDPDIPDRRVEENVEFGRYTLKQKLAAGGMGVVYVAEDRKLKRTVALKMIRGSTFADDGDVARFTLEAEAAAGLDHPHIVPIYEVGRLDGQPFFTMKLIEGQTLGKRLKENKGTLHPREVATLLSKIARAVHHAHQRGVLHRDLKPGNILVDAEGNPWLTDFGLAKLANADSGLTLTKDHIGTPHYMAPEVAGGNARAVSTGSDVWALGVMLWEMLCGMPPFHGPGPVEIMRRIVAEEPSWPPGTRADGDLITIARRCMEKNPARRPQSAGEVADELDRWLRGEPIKARRVTQRERFIKWVRRKPALAALYVALSLGAVTGLFFWQRAERAVVDLTTTNLLMEEALCVSTAVKLAGDARLQVSEDPSRALLLAVASVEMTEAAGVLPEAASSLMSVLQRTGGLDASAGGLRHGYSDGWISYRQHERKAAQVSPDSRWLLSLHYSPKGKEPILAALFDLADRDNVIPVRKWELLPPHVSFASAWCWLPDSRRILVEDGDGKVRIVEVVTTALIEGGSDPSAPQVDVVGDLQTGAWKPDTTHGISSPGVAPGVAGIWRLDGKSRLIRWAFAEEGGKLRTDKILTGLPNATSRMSPGGRWMAVFSGKLRDRAAVVDLEDPGAPLVWLTGIESGSRDAAFSQDGSQVALLLNNETICHFDLPSGPVADGTELTGRFIPSPPGMLKSIAISPDNKWLAITGDIETVTLVPLQGGGEPLRLHFPGGYGCSVRFSGNGRWLAASGDCRVVYLWNMDDIRSGAPPLEFRGMATPVCAVDFSPDTRTVFAIGMAGVVRRWPFESGSSSSMPRHYQAGAYEVTDIAVSPDDEWIASACAGVKKPGEDNQEGFVTLSRINGGGYGIIATHGNYASSVAFSRDGKWLASTGRDGEVNVWDFPALARAVAKDVRPLPAPRYVFAVQNVRTHLPWRITFHPDSRLYLATGDGVLFSWDLTVRYPAESLVFEVVHSMKYVLPDVEVSPDGRLLAIARHGWDQPEEGNPQSGNQVLLFDLNQGSWPPVFRQALRGDFIDFTNISFSPDGRWMAAGGSGHGATIWDLRAPDVAGSRIQAPIAAHLVAGIGFSPDGTCLAMGASDNQLHFWNWQRAGDLRSVHTNSGINTVAWLRDGRLAAAGLNSRVTLWDTDLSRLKALARRIAGRELSLPERYRFRVP